MKVSRIAWLGAVALAVSGLVASQACTSGTEDGPLLNAECGNGSIEGTEECDDGNTDDADDCTNSCLNARCGDGIPALSGREECDDANDSEDDCCLNDCTLNTALPNCSSLCGNGDKDPGEQCDDGGDSAMCDADCTYVECGDGYVNAAAGETCEPSELENCDNCGMNPTTSAGGDPCAGQQVYAGVVTNSMTPTNDPNGQGILSVWSYGGMLGVQAGNDMCQIIGADHVCTYKEVKEAATKGELSSLPDGLTFWLHRVTESVTKVTDANDTTAPGPGGRCNDWTYPTDHIADGEYGKIGSYPDDNGSAGGRVDNGVTFFFDDDTAYDGVSPGGSGPGAGGVCGANNSGQRRALLCCFPVCRNN